MSDITIDHQSATSGLSALDRVLRRLANCQHPAPGSFGLHSVGHVVAPAEGYVGRHRAVDVQAAQA
ncbi:hypothetical protein [Mycolicibacterium smegmatis]|uniref:hypothetical protein n=1 Tax=Mycolicibacterium smegmatis TaxID=1772 RepID=UPI001EFB6EC9|nr:hypothetical protein [Mycolicibacterium smegmatis]ULN72273.1 hypothetical protein KZ782_10440 [Mycolicibacterium smegmatis]